MAYWSLELAEREGVRQINYHSPPIITTRGTMSGVKQGPSYDHDSWPHDSEIQNYQGHKRGSKNSQQNTVDAWILCRVEIKRGLQRKKPHRGIETWIYIKKHISRAVEWVRPTWKDEAWILELNLGDNWSSRHLRSPGYAKQRIRHATPIDRAQNSFQGWIRNQKPHQWPNLPEAAP